MCAHELCGRKAELILAQNFWGELEGEHAVGRVVHTGNTQGTHRENTGKFTRLKEEPNSQADPFESVE